MPAIEMTRGERAALRRLARGPVPASDVRAEYAEKFIDHGLAVRDILRLKITQKGQLEVLRQRYRNMESGEQFGERLDRRLRGTLAGAAEEREPEPEREAGS